MNLIQLPKPPAHVTLTLFVPGKAAPQGSKRSYGRGKMVESSEAVGPWRERIAYYATRALVGQTPIERETPVAVFVEFVMPRPAATPKTRTPPAIRQPDIDKCLRAVVDALTGIAYQDDAQVVASGQVKRLAELNETAGAHIVVGIAA